MQWLTDLTGGSSAWAWLIAGVALMALETLAPGFVFLWFGLAAVLTGLVTFIFHLPTQMELAVFAIAAILSLYLWWRLQRRLAPASADPVLNERAGRHIGQHFVLAEPIISGHGRVKIDDSFWRIAGNDCPAGTKVTVIGVDGPVLLVK